MYRYRYRYRPIPKSWYRWITRVTLIIGAKRALLRMDCPFQTVGGNCYNEDPVNWKCATCNKDVEYLMEEQMIMCKKCKFKVDPGNAEFKCAGQECMGFDTFGNGLCITRKVKRKVNKVHSAPPRVWNLGVVRLKNVRPFWNVHEKLGSVMCTIVHRNQSLPS